MNMYKVTVLAAELIACSLWLFVFEYLLKEAQHLTTPQIVVLSALLLWLTRVQCAMIVKTNEIKP